MTATTLTGCSFGGETIPKNRTKELYEFEKTFEPMFKFLEQDKKGFTGLEAYRSRVYIENGDEVKRYLVDLDITQSDIKGDYTIKTEGNKETVPVTYSNGKLNYGSEITPLFDEEILNLVVKRDYFSSLDVKETFNDVSSLVDRVTSIPLNGGETYQRGYVKSYGDGAGGTVEGGDYNATEPVFGYVTIEKQKITAYTEEPEEMIKLPNADYDGVVEGSVTKAIRRYMSRQILIGDGTSGKFKGIFHNPTETKDQVIDPATDLEKTAIDDGTLDDIIYDFGGDEDVEDAAVLILNKRDLKAFAKLRDKQGRKVYTIVNHGNTGTIDGVPYVINSACGAVTDTQTKAIVYCMAYGPLSNYEMAIFSDIDARKSLDYKFKQGQIAYRADIFAGGAVAAHNGFIRVKRPASA